MKTIFRLYQGLIFTALLCASSVAWGQAQVTGNKYVVGGKSLSYTIDGDDGAYWPTYGRDRAFHYLRYINDGDETTYWYASGTGNRTLEIDMGQSHVPVIGMKFVFSSFDGDNSNSHKPAQIIVRASDDGQQWSSVGTFTFGRTADYLNIEFSESVENRYLQLELQPNRTSYTLAIAELYLYEFSNIQHKRAKWFDLRSGGNFVDTFDDATEWFQINDINIQASHTYIDTIYMHRGTSVTLKLPDRLNESSVSAYQRWYSFRTDGILRTNNTGDDEVWDLLTPATGTVYRLGNGYVGKPLSNNDIDSMYFYYPSSTDFAQWFPNRPQGVDDDWFVIACDVSGYNDYTQSYNTSSSHNSVFINTLYEPTLTHRVLFYIVAVDDRTATDSWNNGHGRLSQADYRGATTTNYQSKRFLEEYDITFPYRRISNHTNELVALSKDARSYAIPGVSASDEYYGNGEERGLDVSVVGNSAGISLVKDNLTGMSRIIPFTYPNSSDYGTRTVNSDGSTATILVTKTVNNVTYNIARYNLTFVSETSLMTESMVEQLEAEPNAAPTDSYWRNFTHRTPKFLDENYRLLTSLNWDYPENENTHYRGNNGEYFYRYPMKWEYSSYSFYDGSPQTDFVERMFPEWGYYAIMNSFVEALGGDDWTKAPAHLLEGSNYHMYIDASDRPGIIARLPFDENLCNGTELFVSAWVKSAGYSSGSDDACMLFTIMGVEVDENGNESYTPIYRHSTGQIRRSDYLTSNLPGTGTSDNVRSNEWLQVYFSFINKSEVEYDHYVLQVDNNSASTNGGDMYLDDVRVYIAQPTADVEQLEYTCANERTPLNISLDWNRLMERLGAEENEDRGIDFCFIDETVFHQALTREHLLNNPDSIKVALGEAVRNIGRGDDPDESAGYNYPVATLYFHCNFDENAEYDVDKLIPDAQGHREYNLAVSNRIDVNNDGVYERGFYRRGDAETDDREITVDFYADLVPNRPYLMLIMDHPIGEAGETVSVEDFASEVLTPCGIQTRFYVTSESLLKVNGEVVDPQKDFCEGQVFNFTAQLRVPTGVFDQETGEEVFTVLNSGVYFDWFFGTEEEFTATYPEYGDESLESALLSLRDEYPDVSVIDETVVAKGNFTDNHRNLLLAVLGEGEEGGLNSSLVLHRENLDIKILADGLQLVVQPIATQMPPEESGIVQEQWANVCWGYIPLELTANGTAPELHAGFNHIEYPSDGFNPNLRIGLEQIAEASGTDGKVLRVELRGAVPTDEDVAYLGPINTEGENEPDYSKIYLIASDDPQYADYFTTENFSQFDLPVGDVVALHAEEYQPGADFNDYAEVRFDLSAQRLVDGTSFTFAPREGYTYTFSIHFEEKQQYGGTVVGSCRGTFPVTMKVVPEYMVWNGTATDNWNNDDMWQRVTDKERLNKPAADTYPDGNGTEQAFVPMLFSKVIIPANAQVELYRAGFAGENGGTWDSDRPSHQGAPTENIQYDLMAYDHPEGGDYAGELRTERYRVNIVDQIHFEPGAEMLHPEYLYYNKAYVDYELDGGKWYTLATPLQEVVAGDFYTGTEGTEGSEYFTDITFGTGNSRFAPSFYQRAWKNSTTTVTLQNNDGLPRNVAVAGNWSALYNDVADPYEAGKGFSLKVQDVPAGTAKVQVRLPKADASYSYYNVEGGAGGDNTAVTRETEKVGKLLVSGMFNRSVEPNYDWQSARQQPVEVTLSESANGQYFLVGNPFMAQLDVQAFLQENSDVLEQKFWAVDDGVQDVAVTSAEGENSWTSTDGSAAGSLLIAPLRSFFVKKLETVTGEVKVTFTGEMQRLSEAAGTATAATDVLRMVATTADGRSSRAAVAFRSTASAGYAEGEDAELFLDSNLGDVPTVYTVGGTQALSINATPAGARIPVGIYGADDDEVTLRFEGVEACPAAELYDAETQTRTALYDGMEVEVAANEAGRYYILTGDGTDGSTPEPGEGVSVYSVKSGEIVVASVTTPLQAVKVYTTDGVLAAEERPEGGRTCRVAVNPDKIYIVHVQDAEGRTVTAKLHVR